ncbi:50S ribosomal protein L25/general stress protein Ctc [Streptomyces alkaliphilus]|uniref:50S ribosomal protein L25/general stress protein Ctc n=1 Tax=Streptomyces alkaliphilus TaxID=1472722 RepID=UPI00117CC2D7|nr:50S ribosomal protein L25/general stress protein Ctc [Streptomyces alkaliphilus]MQS06710.1 50S ribosomal protein L25/general stress protein Ctc [Streptomyces alkaliphilus]
MSDVKISAEIRREFGKGASRRVRRTNRVPAVIYGHGGDPVHVTLPGYDLMMALKNSNVLITLDIEGREELVIPKAVQREVLRPNLVHVDLLVVKKGERVSVEIPIHTEGDLAPGQFLVEHVHNTLSVEAEATHLPESVTVSVQGLSAGDQILAKDVKLPKGTTLTIDGEETIIQILSAQAEEPSANGGEETTEA